MATCARCGRDFSTSSSLRQRNTCDNCQSQSRAQTDHAVFPTFSSATFEVAAANTTSQDIAIQQPASLLAPEAEILASHREVDAKADRSYSNSTVRRQLPPLVITPALIGLCVALYLAMVGRGVSSMHPSVPQLVAWGANNGPLTTGGQWWRLLTAMFLHGGILHLVLNMWCLWSLGVMAERFYGRARFLGLYLVTGIGGGLASLAWHPGVVGVGASGAIFGVAGAMIATFYLGKLHMASSGLKSTLSSLVFFAIYNLAFGALGAGIDNAAHIGGLITGLIFGALVAYDVLHSGNSIVRYPVVPIAMMLAITGGLLAHTNAYRVLFDQGKAAMQRGDFDLAIRDFQASSRRKDTPDAHYFIAYAYSQKNDYDHAIGEYQKALQLDPKMAGPNYYMGMIYVYTKRAPAAEAAFRRELQLTNGANADAQVGLGMALSAQGNWAEAADAFKSAVAVDPKTEDGWTGLGASKLQLKDYENAVKAFRQAAELEPENAVVAAQLARAYEANGMLAEAQAESRRARQLAAKDAQLLAR
jgi:membrane associated rhomboid family serine protease/Flp pilus assembly protein TadD